MFKRPMGEGKSKWVPTAGMNNRGLFASFQEEYPYHKSSSLIPDAGEMFIHQLYGSLNYPGNVKTIENICNEKKLIQLANSSIHSLFADKSGNGVVAEVGKNKNQMTKMKGKFIVMTNFPNNSVNGKNYRDAKGIGSERYIAGYKYLKNNHKSFNMEKGFKTLGLMKNTNPKFPTSCSMVFDPESNIIYIALFTNFQKVFKVSLEEKTITTFKGFDKYKKINIDSNGVSISSLMKI